MIRDRMKATRDLNYSYDRAERMLSLDVRHSLSAGEWFRALKAFSYGTATDGEDRRRGKLTEVSRYNYRGLDNTYVVREQYKYKHASGRLTDRTTVIIDSSDGSMKTLTETVALNDLGQVTRQGYPSCSGCGLPSFNDVFRTHWNGALTAVNGFASKIEYAPNGMVKSIARENGTSDAYTPDPTGLARPELISITAVDSCVQPSITSQPAGTLTVPSNGQTTLRLEATGTNLTFEWMSGGVLAEGTGANTNVFTTAQLTSSTSYTVKVANECGIVWSSSVTVQVGTVPAVPTGLLANASGTTAVNLTWNAVANADSYIVFRKSNGSAYAGGALETTWSAILPSGSVAPVSGGSFDDQHISALRVALNAARRALNLSDWNFTDPQVGSGARLGLRAIHATDIQDGMR